MCVDVVLLVIFLHLHLYLKTFPQNSPGKLFLERDFRPSHLKFVYDLIKNGLIENYLAHKEDFDRHYSFVDQLEDD